ncbi:TetR/AcrR family transcriptional regulator [Streptomyces sp. NPDC049040]|uniref:TetR/AcrR family transcriptional regulator n=1 Tax=Streptomyces sp. NPDC049040 TaxID=3365593 RepID=UPI003714FE1E
MPKVSEEHREARRRQILDAAWVCFARNGFHRTSMPDVFAEAGLSAGAVYRYFPSKEALITAIAEVSTRQLIDILDAHLASTDLAPPEDLLPAIMEDLTTLAAGTTPAPMAVQVWSEMARDHKLAGAVADMLGDIHERMTELCRRYQATGAYDPDLDPGDTARVLIALLQGWIIQWNTLGLAAHQQVKAGLRELLTRQRVRGGG